MLVNLLCWLWIAISAFIFGIVGLGILKRINGYNKKELDVIILFGVCLLTVYAQFFSLIYKVGLVANIVLMIANVILAWLFRKDICSVFFEWKRNKNTKYVILGILLIVAVFLNYASASIENYDTYLYHAQSIRWIEEYGVVPGLGNLHHRFAYNNSIFSLQALFSMRFLWRFSLHSINGFLGLLFTAYVLCSLKVVYIYKFYVSDFFRIGLLYYIVSQRDYISSPGSDFFALCMISYILIKWMTLLEEKVTEVQPYIPLCLMSVFAVSIKLSAAMLVTLAMMPAIRLIKGNRWKEITIYVVWGIIMISPFLIRNVVISGYLLYPVAQIDFFSFDWKMPEFSLLFDKNEIKAWGMGVNDWARYNAPFREWFPVWKQELSRIETIEVYSLPITVIASVGISLYRTIKSKQADWFCVVMTMLAIILFWFTSAPGLRFGRSFLLFFPCFLLGILLERLSDRSITVRFSLVVMLVIVTYNSYPMIATLIRSDWENKIVEKDYEEKECDKVIFGTEDFYIPVEGDQTGYYSFPSTPYLARLELIEMRGDSLKDGFKIKDEYRTCFISNYGSIFAENVFQ